jgi:hypothetical protein
MELYTGLNQKIYLDVFKNEEIDPADANPTVSIYDGETDVLIVTGTSTPEIDDEGRYSYTVLDNYLLTDKLIKAVWTYSVNSNSMSTTNFYDVVTPYVSISDAYSKLRFGREEGDQNYIPFVEMQNAEKFARFMVENYTGVKFGKYSKTVSAYGQDADVLYLGERVISYTQLKENGKLVIDVPNNINVFNFPVEITPTNHSIRIVAADYDINEGGRLDIVYPLRGNFYNGYRYDVVGVFGWKSVPEKIQTAMVMLMKDYFGKDNIWRARFVQNVSFGDTDMEFSKLAFRGTGNFYVDKLLDEFKSTNMAVI